MSIVWLPPGTLYGPLHTNDCGLEMYVHSILEYPGVWLVMMSWKPYNVYCILQSGWTPLHCATSSGHVDIAKMLMDKGADINAVDEVSWLVWFPQYTYHLLVDCIMYCTRLIQSIVGEHDSMSGQVCDTMYCIGYPS